MKLLFEFFANLWKDWLTYKGRGRAKPDPGDANPPVITGPEEAAAQRCIDLSKKKAKK